MSSRLLCSIYIILLLWKANCGFLTTLSVFHHIATTLYIVFVGNPLYMVSSCTADLNSSATMCLTILSICHSVGGWMIWQFYSKYVYIMLPSVVLPYLSLGLCIGLSNIPKPVRNACSVLFHMCTLFHNRIFPYH
jgi:Ni,Fe-hydrogenase I cytochrome b subunit